jgi:ElaB/YqjD/DUF883 family membrane-anchored ribosome-binding protein
MTSDPDQIREHIEETRTSLSQDVNTLADTVNPAHVAKRTAAGARSAVVDVKDKVMGAASQSASGMSSAAGEKVSAAQGQLRRQVSGNPLAVGLIAVGVGWLVGSLVPASSAEEQAAVKVKEAAAPAVTGAAKEAAASLQDSGQQAAESVKATAADAAATVKDEAASSAHQVRDQAQTARDTVTDSRH